MARAKQTNRAEARRRYRQTLVQQSAETDGAEDSEPTDGGPSPAARSAATASGGRPGLGAAFRGAYHAAHYRDDLRALPGLLTLTQPARIPLTQTVVGIPWFLVSALLVIIGFAAVATAPTAAVTVTPGSSPFESSAPTASAAATAQTTVVPTAGSSAAVSPIPSSGPETTPAPSLSPGAYIAQVPTGTGTLLFQFLSEPPGGPTLPILLVGFMATRASYLQGLLIGLLDLALFAVYAALRPDELPAIANVPPNALSTAVIQAAITGLPTSILFAGAAAWYRRFLALSSPKRVPPPRGGGRGRQGGRPATRR